MLTEDVGKKGHPQFCRKLADQGSQPELVCVPLAIFRPSPDSCLASTVRPRATALGNKAGIRQRSGDLGQLPLTFRLSAMKASQALIVRKGQASGFFGRTNQPLSAADRPPGEHSRACLRLALNNAARNLRTTSHQPGRDHPRIRLRIGAKCFGILPTLSCCNWRPVPIQQLQITG